jgi:hypothetical protein
MEVAGPAKSKASADPNRSFGEDNLISSEWESLRELAGHSAELIPDNDPASDRFTHRCSI